MKIQYLLVSILFFISPAVQGDNLRSDFNKCKKIKDNKKRLDCLDSIIIDTNPYVINSTTKESLSRSYKEIKKEMGKWMYPEFKVASNAILSDFSYSSMDRDETIKKFRTEINGLTASQVREVGGKIIKRNRKYVKNLDLYELSIKPKNDNGAVVNFKIKNKGDRIIKDITVTIYFKDKEGTVIFEDKIYTEIYGVSKNLKPNYIWIKSKSYDMDIDEIPTEWDKKSIDAKITNFKVAYNK